MQTTIVAVGLMGAFCLSPVIAADYGKLPLSFEPNRGQTDARVQFLARGAGHTIFLSPNSATFALQGTRETVIRMDLAGAAANAAMEPEDKLTGVTNYLMGSTRAKWPTNLPTFAKTLSKNVYPGIDLIYYGTQSQLEYDFVVHADADPARIRMTFAGATPHLDASGDLLLSADVRLRRPSLYQEVQGIRRAVDGRFTIARGTREVRFRVGHYDHNKDLIIDPVLLYSSYLGGSSQQSVINGMALNSAGQLYVTGITNAVDYPTTAGVFQKSCPPPFTGGTKCGASSSSTAFVSKISADGQSLIYSTYLGGGGSGPGVGGSAYSQGGSGADFGTSIAVDSRDDAWVLGGTNSNNFPVTPDALSLYCEPATASFDFDSNQYVGELSDCARFNGGGEYVYSGSYSLFLVKLNPTGTSILYGTFLGGTQGETPGQIAIDGAGNIVFSGTVRNSANGTPGATGQFPYPTTASAFQTLSQANAFSAFVTEMAPDGHSLVYSSFLSGIKGDVFGGPMALAAGKVFVGGAATSPSLPTTAGAISNTCPSNGTQCVANGFVAEFNPKNSGSSSLVFSTYLNGQHVSTAVGLAAATSTVSALAADSAGNVYAAGANQYRDFPTTPGVLQPTCNANRNDSCGTGYVTKLNGAGALVWSTFYGSPSASGQFGVAAIALDSANDVYITNLADGAGDVPTVNGVLPYASGNAYVSELSSDGAHLLFGTFFGNGANILPTGILVDGSNNIYLTGYSSGTIPLVNALQKTTAGGFPEGFFAKISTTAISPGSIVLVSAASGLPGASAAGSIVSAYGVDLATGTSSATALPLPTNLVGTTVGIVDSRGVNTPAPLFFVSSGQVNFLIPSTVANGTATITVVSGDGAKSTQQVNIVPVSPGLFVVNAAGLIAANVLGLNTGGGMTSGNTFQVVSGAIVPLPVNVGPPAQQVFLVLYGTGISGRSSLANVSVAIGGKALPVVYAGPQGEAGLDQVNVLLPASLAGSGDNTLTITVDGVVSNTAHVTIM